jgi:predicted DNA-binding protein with PD1-like motif
MPVSVAGSTRKMLDALKDETGIAKERAVARILDWFAAQDQRVRFAIVSGQGDAADVLARLKYGELTVGDLGTIPTDRAIEIIRLMVDRIEQLENFRRGKKPPKKS